MRIRVRGSELVPYGVDRWSFADISVTGLSERGLVLDAPFPCAVLSEDTLRLHRLPFDLSGLSDDDGTVPPRNPAAAWLRTLCSHWDRPSLAFIAAWFDLAAELLGSGGEALAALEARFAGLYRATDWLTSFPALLPRAHFHAPPPGAERPPHVDDFVKADLGAHIDGRTIALLSEASFPMPVQAARIRERLEARGIEVFILNAGGPASLRSLAERVLGDRERRFWEGDPVPRGLVPPAGLA